jgi:hypothetical protein
MNVKADAILINLSTMYKDKNAQYGNGHHVAGQLLIHLFPQGIKLETVGDFNRFSLINHIINKLIRYCRQFEAPLEDDHMKDMAVYAAMLMEIDNV